MDLRGDGRRQMNWASFQCSMMERVMASMYVLTVSNVAKGTDSCDIQVEIIRLGMICTNVRVGP